VVHYEQDKPIDLKHINYRYTYAVTSISGISSFTCTWVRPWFVV